MITYIKTKKKVPVDTWPKMLGFPYISTYVFFTCAIISHEPLNVYTSNLVCGRLLLRPIYVCSMKFLLFIISKWRPFLYFNA
jgi:hypothetical protein